MYLLVRSPKPFTLGSSGSLVDFFLVAPCVVLLCRTPNPWLASAFFLASAFPIPGALFWLYDLAIFAMSRSVAPRLRRLETARYPCVMAYLLTSSFDDWLDDPLPPMEPTRLVLHDLAVSEVEPYVLAVKEHAGRLQALHRLAHSVVPNLLRVLVPRHADG